MKHLPLLLLLALLGGATALPAQSDFGFGMKFFSLRDARISLGIGLELALAYDDQETGKSVPLYHNWNSENGTDLRFTSELPYFGYGLAIDLFAPTSLLGFYTEVNYFETAFEFTRDDVSTGDGYALELIEIPVFLKLRPGKIDSPKRLYFMLGGSYSLPIQTEYTAAGRSGTDTNIFRNFLGLGGVFGYEVIGSRSGGAYEAFRSTIFVRGNYRFQSPFNPDYSEPITSFTTNEQLALNDLFVTVGIRLFYRFQPD